MESNLATLKTSFDDAEKVRDTVVSERIHLSSNVDLLNIKKWLAGRRWVEGAGNR